MANGIKYSQPGSLTGGGTTTSTGTSSGSRNNSSNNTSSSPSSSSLNYTPANYSPAPPPQAPPPQSLRDAATKEGQSFARGAARDGSANYQTTTGEVQQVSYSRRQGVPDVGITRAIDSKGGFGSRFASKQIGYSAATTDVNYAAAANTKRSGEIRSQFYESERVRYRNQSFDEQQTDDLVKRRALFAQGAKTNNFQPYGEFVLGRPVSYLGRGVQVAGQKGYTVGLTAYERGDKSLATRGLIWSSSVVRGAGTKMRTDPGGAVSEFAIGSMVGYGIGRLAGGAVSGLASRGYTGTARAVKYGTDTAFIGSGAVAVATTDPDRLGSQLPGIVGGGVGYYKGFSGVVPPKSVSFSPAGRLESQTQSYGGTGRMVRVTGRQKMNYEFTDLGVTKRGTMMARVSAVTPEQSNYPSVIRYDVSTRASYRDLKGNRQTVSSRYDAAYDPDYGVFAGINKRGQSFEVKTSPVRFQTVDGGVSTEAVGVRTTLYNGPKIVRVSEGVNVREAANTRLFNLAESRTPVERANLGGVRGLGVGYDRQLLSGGSQSVVNYRGGARLVLPAEASGFRLLQEQGLYREPVSARVRRAGTASKDYVNDAVFSNQGRTYSNVLFQPVKERPITISKPPSGRGRLTPELNTVPAFAQGYRIFTGFPVMSGGRSVPRLDNASSVKYGEMSDTVRITSVKPSSKIIAGQDYTPRFDAITRSDSIVRDPGRTAGFSTGSPIPPPVFTPRPFPVGLPTFGIGGRGQGSVRGGNPRYEYAPSLTAGVLGIRGSRPGRLTGLEVRPLATGRRKRRKK